jgi:dTDP-4-amino-4,6-dideoxygalactose transaminase
MKATISGIIKTSRKLQKNDMNIQFNDFKKDYEVHGKEYLDAVKKVISSGRYVLGDEVKKFEDNFANYLGAKHCVGTANGLEAIQIALMAYGIGKDDEVITTPISAVATTLAILAVGATPVFGDVNEMGQINTDLIGGLITNKTKAILPVDLYGQPCDLVKIRKICDEHKLIFIEDACQAHGSTLNGKKLGTFGDSGCFSFYPTKNLGAFGDGGAIVTNDDELVKLFRELRDYGQKTKYVHTRYGLNSRLDELQAAILLEKLKYLDIDNEKRREVAKKYVKNLKGINGIKIILPVCVEDSNFHLFVIRTKKRDELREYLAKNGIPSLVHYPITIPDQPMFSKKYIDLRIPTARTLVNEVLSIPCNQYLSNEDVDYVSGKVVEFFRK